MTNFLDAIAATAPPAYTIEQPMLVLAVIEAAYAAARDGSGVPIPDSLGLAYAEQPPLDAG